MQQERDTPWSILGWHNPQKMVSFRLASTPSNVKEWISSSEVAMRDPAAAVIVGTGDGALGASLDVAMVDRGQDVASLAGSDDAAARRARAGARYCLAGSGDAREKKPPRSRAAPGEGRGAITACNAPGRRSPTHFRPGRFRAARRTLRLPARATSSAGWNPSRTSAGTSPA